MVAPTEPADVVLEARGLVRTFGSVVAVDTVDIELRAGEVHALLGENGAGKSTLVKLIAGVLRPNAGAMRLGDRDYCPESPRAAEALGVSVVHQEVELVPTLSVAENVCLAREPRRFGLIDGRAMRRRAEAALARLGLDLDVRRPLGSYPIALKQLTAIARALDVDARVLVLDEPTSSLDADETSMLLDTIRRVRSQGLAIVLVTHFLDQVDAIADRITVLRNGARVGTWPRVELSRSALVEAMTGRSLDALAPRAATERRRGTDARPALELKALRRRRSIGTVTTSVARGEALGLAGLLGAGRTELMRLVAGADTPDEGSVSVSGASVKPGSVRAALAAGIVYLSEDRKVEGIFPELTVRENIAIALQARRGALRRLPPALVERVASQLAARLRIRMASLDAPIQSLSGGNQQKVLLARTLALEPKVLLLDEPTRGIDVGARAEIETILRELADEGLTLMVASSEFDELVRLCDRALVLVDRRVVGELSGAAFTEGAVLRVIAGSGATSRAALVDSAAPKDDVA